MFLRVLIFFLMVSIACSGRSAEIRIAVLGDLDKNRAEIDVLTEKLSKEPGVILVERSEIEKVLREQEIAVNGLAGTSNAIRAGGLLGAQGVIVIKAFDFQGKSVLSARLVAVDSGAIINAWVNDPDMHADSLSWGTAAAQVIVPFLGKLAVSKMDAIPVSVLNIRSAWNNEAGLRFANKLRLLMELRLMLQKEVFVLERWRLGALQWEKELQESTQQFWTGAYIIEGRLERVSEEKDLVEISVFLSLPGQEKPEIIRQSGKLSDPLALVNVLADEILKKMGQRLPADGKLENWKVDVESDAYANEAFWAYRVGQYEASRAAADAAMALGNGNPNLKFVNVKSHLAEFAEISAFSFGGTAEFTVKTNAVIRSDLLTKEKIGILINGIQACKEFAMDAPGNATKFWGAYCDWRILCAEAISSAGTVLNSIERDNKFDKEATVLRKLCRDFAHCVAARGGDSDLIYPFLSSYLNGLPCFSEDPDMMFEEYQWLLSLDFPALPDMRLKIRKSLLFTYSVHDASSYTSQARKLDDWFKQAEKNKTAKDYEERIQKSKEMRDEWSVRMISSTNLSDNISGFLTRKAPSGIPKLLELYNKNFARIATGGDSYDCVACVPRLISAMPGNHPGITLGGDLSVETYCKVLRREDPAKVDLSLLVEHLNYQYVKEIKAEDCRKISQAWWGFKKRLMRENPACHVINLSTIASIDYQIENIRRKTLEDSDTGSFEKKQVELALKEKIELPIRSISSNIQPPQETSTYNWLKKMSYENGKLLVWGSLEKQSRKLPVLFSITPKTWEFVEYRPPSDLPGMKIGDDGIFLASEKNLYYVDENGVILKNSWGESWDFVADAKLKNPTAGCHVGGSLFVAFGKDTNNLVRSTDTGWRSDIIEIPDDSSDIRIFASNTRRPKVAIFDDCRPYETMTMFGSPDGTTLFFGTYMRPCYKLFYCDLKDPLEWKTSLHNHVGSDSRMYGNPYEGGIFFSCVCGHTGSDLKFSRGPEAEKIFAVLRDNAIGSGGKEKKSVRWRTDNMGCPFYNNNEYNIRGSAFNDRNLVFYRCNYISVENYLLCFKEGTSGPFKLLLQKNGLKGMDNLLNSASLSSSEDFLFIFDSDSINPSSSNPCVWILKWEEIQKKIKESASVPEIKITPSIFVDSAKVRISAAEGEKILYSIDAAFDMKTAKAYFAPFEMKESGWITACSVKSDDGIPSLPMIRDCLKMPLYDPVELKNPSPGLRYACWKGAWESLPVFEKIKPFRTGVTAKIDFKALGMEDFFAARYSSFIKVPADGLYRFNIEATGGAMMKIHDVEVHRRPSVWTETLAEFHVGLKAGYHPVEIYFIKDRGKSELKIEWEGAGLARSVLPETIFFIEETPAP